jgi:hypothetical protein
MKTLLFATLSLALLLGACSPAQPISPGGGGVDLLPATEPASVSADIQPTVGYQSVEVVDVAVEVGQGSPIPVFVDIGANLPDSCAQVEFVEVLQDETFFSIYVGTVPSTDEACLSAVGTVPFRMKIPLSVADLPAGSYAVQVNSVPAEFQLDSGAASGGLRTRETPITKDDIQVDNVSIEVGVGSPRPVTAVVSANLPNACAQLGEVQMHREGTQYFVRLIAYTPSEKDCSPDTLPIRLELPLNTINLPDGTYEVLVNGATTTFEMPLK